MNVPLIHSTHEGHDGRLSLSVVTITKSAAMHFYRVYAEEWSSGYRILLLLIHGT